MAFATYLYDRDWTGAEAMFKRALAEASNYEPEEAATALRPAIASRGNSGDQLHMGLTGLGLARTGKRRPRGYPWTIHFNVDPLLDPLRDDPRFGALIRRVGNPDVALPHARER